MKIRGDYRVNFDKISKDLGFKITRKVPDGIREIYAMISSGIISDPYSKKYSTSEFYTKSKHVALNQRYL